MENVDESERRDSQPSTISSHPPEHDQAVSLSDSTGHGAVMNTQSFSEFDTNKNNSPSVWKLKWNIITSAVLASLVAPLLALILWLAITYGAKNEVTSFSSARIGGKLTQPQAKVIDVICSVVLAPCLMAALNYIWFTCARVSVVNERHYTGVPLATLATVSRSTRGSYWIGDLMSLLQGRTQKLSMLAVMVLLSAVANSTIAAIIAYEAYSTATSDATAGTLRYLSDTVISRTTILAPINYDDLSTFDYNVQQQSNITSQITGLLTGLSFTDATSNLDNEAYIGVNSTSTALTNISPNVTELSNIPGFRLTIDCQPDTPDNIQILQMGESTTVIDLFWDIKVEGGYEANIFTAPYPGQIADISGAYNEVYQFTAFLENSTEVYLGLLYSNFGLNISNIISSPYGDIHSLSVNMTSHSFSGTKATMSIWGLRCWLNRQDGLLNYTRTPTLTWNLSASSFSTQVNTKVPSLLAPWQTNINYRAPRSTVPGIGPALALSASGKSALADAYNDTDFKIYALNYLYASGEAQRIAYEVAALNLSRNLPQFFYNASGLVREQHYRMTYVPAFLITGLFCVFFVAVMVVAMTVSTAGTYSARSFRQVDLLRLLVDVSDGLHEEAKVLSDQGLGNDGIEKWAKSCNVKYYKTTVDGEVRIKLQLFRDGNTSGV